VSSNWNRIVKVRAKSSGRIAVVCWTILNAFSLHAQTEFQKRFNAALSSNADSCAACHSTPGPGGSSRMTVTRIQFSEKAGAYGSSTLLHASDQTKSSPTGAVRGERVTVSLMGDGYVEALDEKSIQAALAAQQIGSNGKISGIVVQVPALESPGSKNAIGRFGWKAQHSSLASACADSMMNELGVPNRLYPANTTPRREDDAALEKIVAYVRSLPPPERDHDLANTEDAVKGEQMFGRIGCALCHAPNLRTLPTGTAIDGGTYRVPEQIGGKEIHPYSDFLLHDVGSGDGILQAATPELVDPNTANRFRTAPLWGLRYRIWLMHDGKAVTLHQAIMRHAGEATDVITKYERLTPQERHQLDQFLNSL